jgi:hypothetical protein
VEVKSFAVSVQWGKGMHYIRTTECETLEQAQKIAHAALDHAILTRELSKNHAHPVVYVWELVCSHQYKDG